MGDDAGTDAEVVIPRGKYIGKRLGDRPADEAEHFIRCPECDGWIDFRDLGHVFEQRRSTATPWRRTNRNVAVRREG